jgi:hypothetical protein
VIYSELNLGDNEMLEDPGKDGKIKSILSLKEQGLFTFIGRIRSPLRRRMGWVGSQQERTEMHKR